jgi:hypothetical protein
MIMNDELERTWKEAVVVYLRQYKHLFGGIYENHKKTKVRPTGLCDDKLKPEPTGWKK